jgi:hypothetical protein
MLVREWNGKLERVMILEEGFAWNGQAFGSLSQIAKAITATNWNGHRFFGLRQGRAAVLDKDRSRRSGGVERPVNEINVDLLEACLDHPVITGDMLSEIPNEWLALRYT